MTRNGIAARKQTELKNRRLRRVGPGRPRIVASAPEPSGSPDTSATGTLGRIIDVPASPRAIRHVAIRILDGGGRFRLEAVSELVGPRG